MKDKIQKVIDELERRDEAIESRRRNRDRAESDDWLSGKRSGYTQAIRLLRELLDEESPETPEAPDPGGLY